MSNEIEKYEAKQPSAMIELAMSKGVDLSQLEKVLELQMKWEANEARKAYTIAVAEFKSNPPAIYKDKINKQFGSKYSSIDALVNPAIPYLSKCGLSHSWRIGEADGKPQVTCVLSHKLGHSESVTMSAPPDTSGGGSKNPIQQIKSTQTYLKIATFEAVTGLVSTEANLDDDGNASGTEYITPEMQKEINNLIKSTKADKAKVLKYLKSESVEKILLSDYGKAKVAFETKAKTEKKPIREIGEEG